MILKSLIVSLAIGLCVSAKSIKKVHDTELANYKQKLAWYTSFLEAFMYPNDIIEANSINSKLFAEDVQGRVDLTNTFDGRELNTEVLSHMSCC